MPEARPPRPALALRERGSGCYSNTSCTSRFCYKMQRHRFRWSWKKMSFDYFKNPAPSSAALLGLGERGLLTASLDSRLCGVRHSARHLPTPPPHPHGTDGETETREPTGAGPGFEPGPLTQELVSTTGSSASHRREPAVCPRSPPRPTPRTPRSLCVRVSGALSGHLSVSAVTLVVTLAFR